MFEGVILTHKIVGALAVVFEAMKLGQHEQALHDHSLELSFREAEVESTREPRTRARFGRTCEDLYARAAPVDQPVWSNRKRVQCQLTFRL